MHAALPTIDADRSVCVDVSDLEYAPFAEALWPELSRITSLRMSYRRRYKVPISDEMNQSIKAAMALRSQLVNLSCIQ